MRTLLCANGELGAQIARYLHAREELVGLVLHAPDHQRAIGATASELGVPTWTWPVVEGERAAIEALAPECLLSVLFAHRFDETWLSLPSWRPINLHPGLLPHNAGANPNVWPLVDGSPAGTTLHVMSPVIDAGDLLSQHEVPTYPDDTADRLYERLMDASAELFTRTWPDLGAITPLPMPPGGSRHRLADLASLDPGPDDLAVVDRLRARTFPPYGAEFERAGRRWRIQVSITPVDDA